jgi:DNA-binding transcriptional ArsR family regulator
MTKKELAKILKVVGEENRLLILCALLENKKLCVSAVAEKLGLSVATTSFHLKTLENSGVVKSEREGKEICYSLSSSSLVRDIKNLVCKNISLKI